MNLAGKALSFPFRVGNRGSLVATDGRSQLISEAIMDLLETRQGERVMMPDYGMPDFIFSVVGKGFANRLAYYMGLQLKKYVPLVDSVTMKSAVDEDGKAVIELQYTEVGAVNAPRNLVFPVWRYQGSA